MFTASLLLNGLWLSSIAVSQVPNAQAERKAVKELLTDYYRAFSEVEKSGNKQAVLQYLDKGYRRRLTYLSPTNTQQRVVEDYRSFSRYLDGIIQDYQRSETFTSIAFDSLAYFKLASSRANAAFLLRYLIRRGADTLVLGQASCRFTLGKTLNTWKILEADLVWMDDKQFKPQCACRLTEVNQKQAYAARLTYPVADRYKNQLIHIRLLPGQPGKVIYLDEYQYRWLDGKVSKLDDKSKITELIGTARSEQEAILLVVQQDAYARYCQYGISLR